MLYHGTRRPFRKGGLLLPRALHGGPATTAPTNPGHECPPDAGEYVYMTEDLDVAWAYAWAAVGRGAPRVLEVIPLGEVGPDPEHGWAMRAYRVREGARVVSVLTEPTVSQEEARAGWLVS